MHDDLLSHDEAVDILTPHLEALARCPDHGWSQWERLRADQPAIFAELGRRTRASFIYDATIAQAQREFPGGEGEPRLVKGRGGLTMLEIAPTLRLRFKRMRSNMTTSSIMTAQQQALHLQLPLPGLGAATIATVGYMTNAIETALERKLIVCRLDRTVLWVIDLRADEPGSTVTPIRGGQPPREPRIGPAEGTIEIAFDKPADDQ